MIGVDRVGGQGDSALTIQISQAGWTDVIYLSIYLSIWFADIWEEVLHSLKHQERAATSQYRLCQTSQTAFPQTLNMYMYPGSSPKFVHLLLESRPQVLCSFRDPCVQLYSQSG